MKVLFFVIGGLVLFVLLFIVGLTVSHVRFANKLEKKEPREAR